MLATVEKVQNGYIARFERHLKYPVEQVWSMITENDKLSKWFSELSIDELKEGGKVKFDFGNGTFEELDIIEVKKKIYTADKEYNRSNELEIKEIKV